MARRIVTLCLVVAAASFDGITDHPDRKKAELAAGGSVLGLLCLKCWKSSLDLRI